MKTVTLVPKPGSGLTNQPHRTAADIYLQGRLQIFYGVSTAATVGFFVIMQIIDVALGQWTWAEDMVDPSQLVHLVAALGLSAVYVLLRRHAFPGRTLRLLDAIGLLSVVATALNTYLESHEEGLSPLILGVLSTCVIARAIVVPSSARYTLLLSLPAPLGVLAINLLHGTPEYALASDKVGSAFPVVNLAVLLFGVAVATVASRVTFALRTKVQEAQRLGEYRVEALVGEGGMGKVYRATHAMLRRATAIKILDPGIAAPKTLERFEREVRLTSRLSHPHNVQVYDYGTTADALFYYAMEYLEGMDLAQAVEASGPLPPGRLIHVIANACDALAEAHALGLVHRDVKPANVFLCRRGGVPDFVKVLDYGIARALDAQETTATGVVAGTPDYMAPEVIRGDGIQPASDIYALGATAYEALTGWRVFGGRALRDLLLHHLQTEPIPPRKRLASVPADLEAVILRCLAKEPEDRHPDMHALAEALRACRDAGTWTPADAEGWWREHGAHAGVPRAPEGGAEGR